jgi:hypothetical protein
MAYKIPFEKEKESKTLAMPVEVKTDKAKEKKLFLLKEIKDRGTITEGEILLVKRRLQDGTYSPDDVADLYELELTPEQTEKGINWLKNTAFMKSGETRKNSPFGSMEEEKIKTFKKFEFGGFQDIGTYGFHNYAPVYIVTSENGSFKYYIQGGTAHIQ